MYQTATNIIVSELKKVDNEILKILSSNNNFLTPIFIEYILRGSKKIRSSVAILAGKALNGEFSDRQLLICAITEIIHNASLIHDDIVDNADIRRGNESFNKLYDNSTAVLSGDYLISLVLQELIKLNDNNILQQYIHTFSNLCKGEINQLEEKNQIISIEKYLEKTENKTAKLFETTLFSVFMAENQVANIDFASEFGKNFGIAFQIRDDIKNFTQKTADKPKLSDLENGICTLPAIIFAKENNISDFSKINSKDIQNSEAIAKSADLCTKYANNALDLIQNFSDNQYVHGLKILCEELKRI